MTEPRFRTALVIGAGVIGVSSALALRRRGLEVCLVDPSPVANGCSFGNAGVFGSILIPLSSGQSLRSIAGLFLSKTSPATIDAASLPGLASWGRQFLKATAPDRVRSGTVVLHDLCRQSIAAYRHLLDDPDLMADRPGCLHAFLSPQEAAAADPLIRHKQDIGVNIRKLTAAEVGTLEPSLAGVTQGATIMADAGHTPDPKGFVERLASVFTALGGKIVRDRIVELKAHPTFPTVAVGEKDCYPADCVVIATGSRVNDLTRPLGYKLPLIAERGYHVEIELAAGVLTRPVIFPSTGAVLTPSVQGTRLVGLSHFGPPGVKARPELLKQLLARTSSGVLPMRVRDAAEVWSGERPTTPDSVPVIDRLPRHPNIVVNTGHGHGGLTLGGISGRLAADLLLGQGGPLLDALSARRFVR